MAASLCGSLTGSHLPSWLGRLLGLVAFFSLGAAVAPPARAQEPSTYILVWLYDAGFDDSDFLAVVDADPASPSYARVVHTVPVGARGMMAHHTNYEFPAGGRLFANGYYSGLTFVLDVRHPTDISVVGSFSLTPAPYFRLPHSFVATGDGNTLAAFQDGADLNAETVEWADGALVEMDPDGRVLRTASAADPTAGEIIHPYSLDVLPAIDRIVTGNGDIMRGGPSNHVVQVWSLSGLERLHTIRLEHGPRGVEASDPVEPRALADGRSAMVITDNCGLYYLDGVDGDDPSGTLVHDFGGRHCGVPAVSGNYWIQTVPGDRAVIVMDVSDPWRPRETGRVTFDGEEDAPHWIAVSPDGRRVLLSAGGGIADGRLILMDLEPETGRLTVDPSFRDAGSEEIGISFAGRDSWPHGATGPAISHGAVFWQEGLSSR